MALTDQEAWEEYPTLRSFFNKLWIADSLGYKCGPVGIPIPEDGKYVVRPTYNPNGMGASAKVFNFKKGDIHVGPLGHFWCEYFEGPQYSADFKWDNKSQSWIQGPTYTGVKPEENLSKFTVWKRVHKDLVAPSITRSLSIVNHINVEYIGDKPIEVHLRVSPDPQHEELVPIWEDTSKMDLDNLTKQGYVYIPSYDNANGFISVARIGFMVK